jgi:bifunctional N-acetylglucosamine-1-phosphate-uridyltransferase/glucosamine-1-phosphate-acetyltransferase GlmU-like protein
MSTVTIVMAGGLGKRMNSNMPKVLHKVNDYPMIYYVLKRAIEINSKEILVIVGKYQYEIENSVKKYFTNDELVNIHFINQPEIIENGIEKVGGTGHAIKCCLPHLTSNNFDSSTNILILSGDVPLLSLSTLQKLSVKQNTLLITQSENPTGCGRVFFNRNSQIEKIVEEKDCDELQKNNNYINCGIYYVNFITLVDCIPLIQNKNKSGEYYLTDLIEIALKRNHGFFFYELEQKKNYEVMNINTPYDLEKANENTNYII